MEEIVRSDLYKNRDDRVIDDYVDRNLKMFDEMEWENGQLPSFIHQP